MACRDDEATCQPSKVLPLAMVTGFPRSLPSSLGPGAQWEETEQASLRRGGDRVSGCPVGHRYTNQHEQDARFWDEAVLDTAPYGEEKAFCTACAHGTACGSALPR